MGIRADAANVGAEVGVESAGEFGDKEVTFAVSGEESGDDPGSPSGAVVSVRTSGAVGVGNAGEDFETAAGGNAADHVAIVVGEVEVAGGVDRRIDYGVERAG